MYLLWVRTRDLSDWFLTLTPKTNQDHEDLQGKMLGEVLK